VRLEKLSRAVRGKFVPLYQQKDTPHLIPQTSHSVKFDFMTRWRLFVSRFPLRNLPQLQTSVRVVLPHSRLKIR
jgi:hypothetical protein